MVEKQGANPQACVGSPIGRVPQHGTESERSKTFRRGQGGRSPALTPSQIEAARKLRTAGMSISELVEIFGCGRATIHRYVAGA